MGNLWTFRQSGKPTDRPGIGGPRFPVRRLQDGADALRPLVLPWRLLVQFEGVLQ